MQVINDDQLLDLLRHMDPSGQWHGPVHSSARKDLRHVFVNTSVAFSVSMDYENVTSDMVCDRAIEAISTARDLLNADILRISGVKSRFQTTPLRVGDVVTHA